MTRTNITDLVLRYPLATTRYSAYNVYMKSALTRVKKENANLSHKEAFTLAAKQWKTHPSNPKREK